MEPRSNDSTPMMAACGCVLSGWKATAGIGLRLGGIVGGAGRGATVGAAGMLAVGAAAGDAGADTAGTGLEAGLEAAGLGRWAVVMLLVPPGGGSSCTISLLAVCSTTSHSHTPSPTHTMPTMP